MKKLLALIGVGCAALYHFFKEQLNYTYVKVAYICLPILTIFYGAVLDFYSPVWPLLGYMMGLGAIDLITGLWASKKEGIPWTSRRFWMGKAAVVALFLMGLTTMLIMDKMLKELHQEIPNICFISWMLFYGAYECISVLENMARIGRLKGIPQMIKRIKSIFPSWVSDSVDEAKNDKVLDIDQKDLSTITTKTEEKE